MIGDGGRIEALGKYFTGHRRARQTMRRSNTLCLALRACGRGRAWTAGADFSETLLPAGAKAVWDLDKAFRETTYSRSESASTGCGSGSRQYSLEHARRGDATECRPDVVLRHQQRRPALFISINRKSGMIRIASSTGERNNMERGGVQRSHPRSSPRNAECRQPETIRARTEVLGSALSRISIV